MNSIGARGSELRPDLLTGDTVAALASWILLVYYSHEDVTMKVYEGGRSLDGSTVTVDGEPLPQRHDLLRISKTGFEWGFDGPAPAQLALALLADHLGDNEEALRLHRAFMREIVAHLDNAWRLTGADIDAALGRG